MVRGEFPGRKCATVSQGKHVADDQNEGFRMSLIEGRSGVAVNQALVGKIKLWFERFGNL